MAFEAYLKANGFRERAIECSCPNCVTVSMFIQAHPIGRYVLMCCNRAIPVSDGVCLDSDNCLDDTILYYYEGGK